MRQLLVALVGFLWLSVPAGAEDPVYFVDFNLKAAVEDALWISDPTPTEMLGLSSLNAEREGIANLEGLEYADNLESLVLSRNEISDVSALSGLSNLQTLVIDNCFVADLSPLSTLRNLSELDVHDNGISDISALSGLTNLETLNLRNNRIQNISALSGLIHVRDLDLQTNFSDLDLSPLSAMVNLETLRLCWNSVSDLSPLSGPANLRVLDLRNTRVRDVSPLTTLHSLTDLYLESNPLNEEACAVYLPQIQANNPGASLAWDQPCGARRVLISSTVGGSVTYPGEGEFLYDNAELVQMIATADPCFVFASWSGTYASRANPMWITMTEHHQIRANFVSLYNPIHVDDDSPSDPRPNDAAGSDPQENGSADHPFDRIQEAIDVAGRQTVVLVHPGTYRENIDFLGKRIHVIGTDLSNPRAPYPTIEGAGPGPVVRFNHGEDPNSRLAGFFITDSENRSGNAILCSASSPTIANCLIAGNRRTEVGDAVISCTDSNAVFVNCTIADNYADEKGAGLLLRNSSVTVVNSILWANMPREIVLSGTAKVSVQYSTVTGGWPGLGNRSSDPLFAGVSQWVDPQNPAIVVGPDRPGAVWVTGDYHLQSQAGRWDPDTSAWVQDKVTSPCIDAGDPATPVGQEPSPNGGIINMGAYGGTAHASKTYVPTTPQN